MSANIVSQAHIATLAVFASGGTREIGSHFGGLVEVANKLAAENAASVNYRYQQTEATEPFEFSSEGEVFKHARMELVRNPVVILKAVQCLVYQSCEHPTWKESEAHTILANIRSAAIRKLPGYNEAEGWSIEAAPKKAPAGWASAQGGVQ